MNGFEPKEVGIIIIESLGKKDKKTGTDLYNHILKYKSLEEPILNTELIQVDNKIEFDKAFQRIFKKVTKEKFYPILHIEAHGSEDGIELASGEIVFWKEFFNLNRKLNVALRNSLTIKLALCEGMSLIGKFPPNLRAPFNAIVASFKKVSETDMLKAFEAFYLHFFFSFSHLDSVELMNKEIGSKKPVFHAIKAEHIFDEMLNEERDPASFDQIITRKAIEERATNPTFTNVPFVFVLEHVKKVVKRMFEDTRSKRNYFLMEDLKTEKQTK